MTEPNPRPENLPENPNFSSGPCAKRPGWSVAALEQALTGRSHRSKAGKARIQDVMDLSRKLLGIPDNYRIGLVPGSDTGAFEMALWSLLGERGVDALSWESFGAGWVSDIQKQLKISDVRVFNADYGQLPDLSKVDTDRDVVFTWNGTTSGVKIPNGDWISNNRKGLTICDATSAVFAMELPWQKLDVVTYSWQKSMGGEAAHGILILSPNAVKRLESFIPPWPLPKVFRLTKNSKLIEGIFGVATINTPSMICIEDALDGLKWAESVGGIDMLIRRSKANLAVIASWVEQSSWASFLAEDNEICSNTSICLRITDSWYQSLPPEEQTAKAKELTSLLDKEGIAYDIGSYRDAPPGIRIWGGPTVETSDIEALLPWLDWAFGEIKETASAAT